MKTALQFTLASLIGYALFGLALFWPAGTFDYWQAWVLVAVYVALSLVFTVYVGVTNPDVVRRRLRVGPVAETRPVQKVVATAVYVVFSALLIVSAFDHRFGWSHVPAAVCLSGDVLVAIGLAIIMLVVLQNNYAAATITVEAGQPVVSTGMYGQVRHPMYSGALITMVGVPLALGSYWALLVFLAAPLVLVVRIFDEEKALAEELDGYRDYTKEVRYRLVPHVW